jgi:hypothetical protein
MVHSMPATHGLEKAEQLVVALMNIFFINQHNIDIDRLLPTYL